MEVKENLACKFGASNELITVRKFCKELKKFDLVVDSFVQSVVIQILPLERIPFFCNQILLRL